MSYAEIKPQYYQMHQPDSPWHAGSPGWKDAPWPSWGVNPNLVGPPRLAVEGLGAYFAPKYERPINGLGAYFAPKYETPISGLGACPCAAKGVGDSAVTLTTGTTSNKLSGALLIGLGAAVILGGVFFLGPHRH